MRGMEALSASKMKKRAAMKKRPSREVMVVPEVAHPFGCAPWDPEACPTHERRVVEPPWWDSQVAGNAITRAVYEVTPSEEDAEDAAALAKQLEESQKEMSAASKKAGQQPRVESFKMRQIQLAQKARGASAKGATTPKNPRVRRPSREERACAEALRACGLKTACGLRVKQQSLTIVRV